MIQVRLPEVRKEHVKVTAEEGTLTVRGERKSEKRESAARTWRTEVVPPA